MGAELTTTEQAQLERCETVIAAGRQTFIEVGNALMEIRDNRLYKAEYKSFEGYCLEKWGFKRGNAHDLIETANAAKTVQDIEQFSTTPTREQVRPLTKLDTPDQQREAWQDAVTASGGKPTAKHVEAAVEKVQSRGRPIEPLVLTPDQQQKVEEAERDSENLWLLKSYWKKANRKERTAFREWLATQ